MIDVHAISATLKRVAAFTGKVSGELCAADGALGDGDLGITVANGFAEASKAQLPDDIGMAFLVISKSFQRVSSSSFGTLVATAFMAAAKQTKGTMEIDPADLSSLVAAARDAMMNRGKGQLGDKTVLDSLDAISKALEDADPDHMRESAAVAARETVENFKGKPNRLGRARIFGEKSIGLVDPGQLAMQRIVEGL